MLFAVVLPLWFFRSDKRFLLAIAFLSSSLFPSSFLSFFLSFSFLLAFHSLVPCYPGTLLSVYPSIPCSFLPWYILFPFIWLSLAFSSFPSMVYLASHYLSLYRVLWLFYAILYNLILFITYNLSQPQRAQP